MLVYVTSAKFRLPLSSDIPPIEWSKQTCSVQYSSDWPHMLLKLKLKYMVTEGKLTLGGVHAMQ